MPTYIRFGEDHSVAVQEELRRDQEADRRGRSRRSCPLFEATRVDGAKMLVNANEIRTISEGKKKDGGRKG